MKEKFFKQDYNCKKTLIYYIKFYCIYRYDIKFTNELKRRDQTKNELIIWIEHKLLNNKFAII